MTCSVAKDLRDVQCTALHTPHAFEATWPPGYQGQHKQYVQGMGANGCVLLTFLSGALGEEAEQQVITGHDRPQYIKLYH